jgi:F0F1-type ATP synthase assembly protein I
VSAARAPSSRRRRPLPIGAIAAALCVAVLGALPGLVDSWGTLRAVLPDYLHALPVWSHAIEAVIKGMMTSRSGAVMRWITAALFIGAGTLLARATTRRRLLEGGLG